MSGIAIKAWDRRSSIALAAAVLAVTLAGCGRGGSSSHGGLSTATVSARTNLYNAYMAAHKGQPPKSEADFRQYLETQKARLEQAGLTVDQVFISPRSGEQLVWVYGRQPPRAAAGLTILGYEKNSLEGQRLVVGARGMHLMIDETQFKRLFPDTQQQTQPK